MPAINNSEGLRRLGDFEIVRELGRGGMGVVYEARQVSLNRKVALKVLSGGLGLTPKAVQRFRREAEAAAKLHHTNIVPVYATGEEDGTHFYAMELIDGPSLDHVIRQLRERVAGAERSDAPAGASETSAPATPPGLEATGPYVAGGESTSAYGLTSSSLSSDGHYFDTVARMIAEVADALEYAHQQGVIHRDIKPSNLLLSPAGRLSVNDFGLARMLEQPGMTMTGEFVGTPAYMSPEQIAVGRISLDHRTDIYSLGATLYELLTLGPPFRGQSREQVLAQIVQKEPKAPRRIQKRVPIDLETICLKCLEKDPDRRYQTAGELAEDLRRYVNRFAIQARRAGPVGRLRKWVKRHPGLAAGVGLALVAIIVASFFAMQSWRERQERLAAEEIARQKLLTEKKHLAEFLIFSGKFPEAETAIAEAESLGVEEEWAQWRRGLMAYHSGEDEKAYELLKLAVARMPDNVAATCQLVLVSDWEQNLDLHQRFLTLIPTTPEDFIYMGWAQSSADPINGLRALDEGVSRQPSVIAHTLRAQVRAMSAQETSDLAAIEKAKADANAAKSILSGNPFALQSSVQVHIIAAGVYARTGQAPGKREEALKTAREDAAELARFPDLTSAVQWRGLLLLYEGRDEEALAVLEKNVAKDSGSAQRYALGLYRRGQKKDVEEAIEILNRHVPDGVERDHLLPIFLAELDRVQAVEYLRKKINTITSDDVWLFGLNYYPTLFLLGDKDYAIQVARKYSPNVELNPVLKRWRENTRSNVDYLRDPGPATADKMLRLAGREPGNQAFAHWIIGYVLLGGGDREGARQHFEACVATQCFDLQLWRHQCRVFLERMKKDPNWPLWIPVKKQ